MRLSAHTRGGTDLAVRFFSSRTNLHRLCDGDLLDRTYADPEALAAKVLALATPEHRKAWEAGYPAAWASESHGLAVQVAYAVPPGGELDDAYVAKALPVIHEQPAKGGGRLAWFLNRVFQ